MEVDETDRYVKASLLRIFPMIDFLGNILNVSSRKKRRKPWIDCFNFGK